jgi:hypothetical protein
VWDFDGHATDWTFDKYLRESILDVDEDNNRRFEKIREFEIGYPSRLCQAGVVMYDSPGLDENPRRMWATREAAKRCDAAIAVYRIDALMGQSEMQDISSIQAEGIRVFTVINMMSGRPVDDRARSYVWNKYIRDHLGTGETYAGQDLTSEGIFFVDALSALKARTSGNDAGIGQSGLSALERSLAEYLTSEREKAHVGRWAAAALNISSDLISKTSVPAIDHSIHLTDVDYRMERITTSLSRFV